MKRILILFAHPAFEKSRVNKLLIQGLDEIEGVTFHDLYLSYPEMNIDRKYEQQLVEKHDIVIFHHPFLWYSTPSILKEWQDLVLTHGWAYGSKGGALKNKLFFNVISTGGPRGFYVTQGRYNKYSMRQLLAPVEQTVNLCQMTYLPPFVIHGTHSITKEEIMQYKLEYDSCLSVLRNEKVSLDKLMELDYLNDYKFITSQHGK